MIDTLHSFASRVPVLGQVVCEHPTIRISAFGRGGIAVYRCDTCRARVKPWELDGEYQPVTEPTSEVRS